MPGTVTRKKASVLQSHGHTFSTTALAYDEMARGGKHPHIDAARKQPRHLQQQWRRRHVEPE
jgi:phage protein U